jgi:hypothetical protein
MEFKSIFNEKYLKNSAAANSESTQGSDSNSDPTGKYYKYCRNFTDQSNQPKNYLIYHTKDDIIKSSGDIIEISGNADIDKLTNVEYIKVDDLFAYVIITTDANGKLYDHLLLAKIKNVLEIGAKHMIIARYYNAKSESGSENAENVVSAGVIKKTGDTTFIFNLDSGTYLSREVPTSKQEIRDLTTTFFSNISRIKDNQISFKYNADTSKYTAPEISQVNVNDLCEKKKDEVLLVDKCDDKWENNYKIVKDAVKPPNSESICSAATAESRAVAQANAAIAQANDAAKQSENAQISATAKAKAKAADKAKAKAADKANLVDDARAKTADTEALSEAANLKVGNESKAILGASIQSIEFIINKISGSNPNYLKPMNEKMTDLLKIMKEIVI